MHFATYLNVHNVSLFKNNKYIINNISFSVSPSSTLLLTGPNGSGKSSLLKIIAGLIDSTSGNITHLKTDNKYLLSDFDSIHYISNNDPIHDDMTVYDNISYWFKLYDPYLFESKLNSGLQKIGNIFALEHLYEIPAKHLSLGQRKRLSLSRLLMNERSIWLLDEPTIGLDRESVSLMAYLINAHRKMGGITVISSHLNVKLEKAYHLSLPLS